jgi:hypothetical protein
VHLAGNHAALEQLFRARVIAFLVEAGLLPLYRARILRGWVHSGFQVFQKYKSIRVGASRRMSVKTSSTSRNTLFAIRSPWRRCRRIVLGDSILYRSGMNAKIKRNFFIHGSIHAGVQRVRFHRSDYAAHFG